MKKDANYNEMLVDTSKIDKQLDKIGEEVDKINEDLEDYVKNTDYATSNKGGVVKTNLGFEVSGSTGHK